MNDGVVRTERKGEMRGEKLQSDYEWYKLHAGTSYSNLGNIVECEISSMYDAYSFLRSLHHPRRWQLKNFLWESMRDGHT